MRLVKKTVNQDDPGVYHLFYGDDEGSPGFDLTFFEYPGAVAGTAGDGMVHTVVFRVGSPDALGFWAERLAGAGVTAERVGEDRLRFADPEGLGLELVVADVPDRALVAASDVPPEHALQGFHAVRAYGTPAPALLEGALGFRPAGEGAWEARGSERGGTIAYEPAPAGVRARPGGGTVHHVAWAMRLGEQDAWQERVSAAGARATPVIDRFYFRSVYFREPSGVLFELATMGPGFAVDEDPEHLGEGLALPPFLEPHRARIEPRLTPLPDVRRVAG
jgi:glyoxalase family protein